MIFSAIVTLVLGAILTAYTGQWFYIGCAAGIVAANVIVIILERRDRKRRKAVTAAVYRNGWLEVGTIQRRTDGGYEIWDGKNWTRV